MARPRPRPRLDPAAGRADRDAAEAALVMLYAAAALPPPSILWRPSPIAGARAIGDLVGLAASEPGLRRVLGRPAIELVLDRPHATLRDTLRAAAGELTRAMLATEVGGWLAERLRPLRTTIETEASRQLGRPPGAWRGGQLSVWPAAWEHALVAAPGRLDADRVAVTDVARRLGIVLGPAMEALLEALVALTAVGWWWPYERVAVLVERPSSLRLDEEGRPHAPDGPAVAWGSDWEVFAWHGTVVPRRVIEIDRLTPPGILAERNIELRRLMIERYGLARFRRDAGAELVHRDRWGRLWRLRVPGDEPLTTVEVVNATPEPDGTRRRYELRVPPTMRTALGAVAWTFGVPPAEYARRMRRET